MEPDLSSSSADNPQPGAGDNSGRSHRKRHRYRRRKKPSLKRRLKHRVARFFRKNRRLLLGILAVAALLTALLFIFFAVERETVSRYTQPVE